MKKNIFFSLLFLLLFSCNEDDSGSLIPIIETKSATVPISGGVALFGNIVDLGKEKIIRYGFNLTANSNYNVDHSVSSEVKNGSFQLTIDHGLYPNIEYFFYAFIETENKTYRGERLSFISKGSAKIQIDFCTPKVAHINDTVVLSGNNFPLNDNNNLEFKFGNSYSKVISISKTELKFIVPKPDRNLNTIEIKAFGNTYTKNNLLNLYKPTISNIKPASAFYLDTITIVGKHFNNTIKHHNSVHIGNQKAEILEVFRDSIKVIIPLETAFNNAEIQVFSQDDYAYYPNFSLYEPKFLDFPREIYLEQEYTVKFDREIPRAKFGFTYADNWANIFINNDSYKMVIYANPFDQRENPLVWKVSNDKEIISDFNIKIINPFLRVSDSYKHRITFKEPFLTSSKEKPYVLATNHETIGLYLYTYNPIENIWEKVSDINYNNDFRIFLSNVRIIYSEFNDEIYGVTNAANGGNFFKINIASGNVTQLSNLPSFNNKNFYSGVCFSYEKDIYFISGKYLNEIWQYNTANDSWSLFNETPFDDNSFFDRGYNVCINVIDNFAYFNNGAEGNQYSDFWKLNLETKDWTRLADNPNPNKKSTSFVLNNEIFYINQKVYKYNIVNNNWLAIENSGIRVPKNNKNIFSFIQNGIPYVLDENIINSFIDLRLYKGDLLK